MKREWRGQVLFVLLMIGIPILIYLVYAYQVESREYLGPVTKGPEGERIYHTVAPFHFVNQQGYTISEADVAGKVYVANFFFVACPTICPAISAQLLRVQDSLGHRPDFRILSHTVDPKRDSVPVLNAYANKLGIDAGTWHLLTGDKPAIYLMARNSYLVTAVEGDGGPQDFIHSEKLVLIDRQGHIRGYYDGTNPKEVDQLIRKAREVL